MIARLSALVMLLLFPTIADAADGQAARRRPVVGLLAAAAVWGVVVLGMQARNEDDGPTDVRVRPDLRQVTERPVPAAAVPVERDYRPGVPAEPELDLPPPQSRWWMKALRGGGVLVAFLTLLGVTGGILSLSLKGAYVTGPALFFGAMLLWLCYLHVAVFVAVREGSRCRPTPQPINSPLRVDAEGVPTGKLAELQFGSSGLLELGFEPAGWFYLDNPIGPWIGVWRHATGPDLAFVFVHEGGTPRLRVVRRFAGGTILISSTRQADLCSDPAAGVYLQVRVMPTARHLWSWHLDAARLFDEEAMDARADPMALYQEVTRRYSEAALQARWWWLPGSGGIGEIVRTCCLYGVPVEEQIEDGWAPRIVRGPKQAEAAP